MSATKAPRTLSSYQYHMQSVLRDKKTSFSDGVTQWKGLALDIDIHSVDTGAKWRTILTGLSAEILDLIGANPCSIFQLKVQPSMHISIIVLLNSRFFKLTASRYIENCGVGPRNRVTLDPRVNDFLITVIP